MNALKKELGTDVIERKGNDTIYRAWVVRSPLIQAVFILLLFIVCLTPFHALASNTPVPINETTFPDVHFRTAVLENYSDGNGHVNANVTKIDVSDKSIGDLTGIEYFTALTTLHCYKNALTTVNLSSNTLLKYLEININRLTSLDISNNTALEYLWCDRNQLTSLDVSNNAKLKTLACYINQLTMLDISNNPGLTGLYCQGNQLTTLDVSNHTGLEYLNCDGNQLTSLNVLNNTALIDLSCGGNQLFTLDISNNTLLEELGCSGAQLTALDVSNNPALFSLFCWGNQLTTLDISNNTALGNLTCGNNQLTSLDVSMNTALMTLYCDDNQLSSLDLSGNTQLIYTTISDQQAGPLYYTQSGGTYQVNLKGLPNSNMIDMTRVTMTDGGILNKSTGVVIYPSPPSTITYTYDTQNPGSGETSLSVTVSVSAPQIIINETTFPDVHFRNAVLENYSDGNGHVNTNVTNIDVSTQGIADLAGIEYFTELTHLDCSSNQLTSLDVSHCTGLFYLECSSNQLTSLDTSYNTLLTALYCYENQLTSLDVSKSTALEWICCAGNQLTSLDVSNNTALWLLDCPRNQLTSLDVSKNSKLVQLGCNNNLLTSLDISKNSVLVTLDCGGNQLISLDVSKNTALETLGCDENQLTLLDVSKNSALDTLDCSENQLTSIDVSNNTALESLGCFNNQIASLDVAKNSALNFLECSGNQLASLDLSGNLQLANTHLADQTVGPLVYSQSGDTYQVDLTTLPNGNLIDFHRVSMTDGGQLDIATGIVTYVQVPAKITYNYDTQNPGSGDTLMSVTIDVSAPASNPGDANGDETVDIMDLVVIVDYIVNGNNPASMSGADANGDGTVDIMDLVYIINLIVNPPVSSGVRLDAVPGDTFGVEVPFSSSVPITALELNYTLSPGLTFVNAECSSMVGAGGDTNAVFANVNGGVTSGTVTLEVALQNGVTANQSITVTVVTGANTVGTHSVGIPETYIIDVNASALSILTQPVDATVSVGNTATFTVEAAGPEPLTYQWYVNTNTGVGWLAIAGATENTYTTGAAVTGDDGFRYFCRVTAGESYLDSALAALTVVAYPQTGDDSHPYWLLAVALLAAVCVLVMVRRKWRSAN